KTSRNNPMKKIILPACLALAAFTLSAQEAAPDDGLWRPTPSTETQPPFTQNPPREPRAPARLSTMTLDGTFESFNLNDTLIHEWLDEFSGVGSMFGGAYVRKPGYPDASSACVVLPASNFGVLGFEEKNLPLKPNTWYRLEFMLKGVPQSISFGYPREKPTPENAKTYMNYIAVDSNHGSHSFRFCLVCRECGHVQWGDDNKDGKLLEGGFKVLPDTCPKCDAEGSLYRDGDRRPYYDWTLVYEDFKTGDYVGMMAGPPYYWHMTVMAYNSELRFDNIMLYEITGEGGEAVGGDFNPNRLADGRVLPPPSPKMEDGRPSPKMEGERPREPQPQDADFTIKAAQDSLLANEDATAVPVEVGFGKNGAFLAQRAPPAVNEARRRYAEQFGVPAPAIKLTAKLEPKDGKLAPGEAAVAILGETVWRGEVIGDADPGAPTAEMIQKLSDQVAASITANAHRLLTLHDVHGLLERARERNPVSVAELEKALPLDAIHAVLAALLADNLSIVQFPLIADVIAGEAQTQKDPADIAAKVKEWLAE
ncbi:MAG: FHIPEP family type III secretion protein, partial [Kiritimatiellaeota bacterium]|nr:FHIPEP family type III secretion protein [Kiritimatiellota bacterium]